MVLVTDKQFYLHRALKDNIDYYHKGLKKKWDFVMVIDGEEGSGKTTIANQIGYYSAHTLGTTFNLTNIVFTTEQANHAIDTLPPYSVIQWDEFVLSGGTAAESGTKIQRLLVKKFTTIRKKNLIIILVIPYIFLLKKYFAIARTRCLVNVFSPDNLTRGDFMFYSKPNKKNLYLAGHKTWDYTGKSDFHGDFRNTEGMFYCPEEYDKKKEAAIISISDNENINQNLLQRNSLIVKLYDIHSETFKEIAKTTGMSVEGTRNAYHITKKSSLT